MSRVNMVLSQCTLSKDISCMWLCMWQVHFWSCVDVLKNINLLHLELWTWLHISHSFTDSWNQTTNLSMLGPTPNTLFIVKSSNKILQLNQVWKWNKVTLYTLLHSQSIPVAGFLRKSKKAHTHIFLMFPAFKKEREFSKTCIERNLSSLYVLSTTQSIIQCI